MGPPLARPRKKIDAKKVESLAVIGCTATEIARFYDVSVSTISRGFAKYLTKGKENCKQRLRRKQMAVAMQGNVQMLIWLGKQMLGQKEPKTKVNLGGSVNIILERE